MLEIKNITAHLGKFSLTDISLRVEKGDYLTLLGMSGAGKTVLLEVLSGLVKPFSGQIFLHQKDITHEAIQKRPFGLVYQDMALFPHLKVRENIAFSLKDRKLSRQEKQTIIHDLAQEINISHLLDRYPETLSGGEAQRVALARTLVRNPEILLLDEPLANLDIKLREDLRKLLRTINKKGTTIIHVTHDYLEAATLSNKVAIIEEGRLIQWGNPQEVFRNPVSEFAARFSGIKNIFYCRSFEQEKEKDLFFGITKKNLKIHLVSEPGKNEGFLMVPGEDIIVSEKKLETSAINQLSGVIKDIFMLNHGVELIIDAGEDFAINISRLSYENMHLEKGIHVWISFKASAVRLL